MAIAENPKGYNKTTAENYVVIPAWITAECGLSYPHRDVYAVLYGWNQGNNSWVEPTQGYIGELVGINRTNTNRTINELEAAGWIEKVTAIVPGKGCRSRYHVITPNEKYKRENPLPSNNQNGGKVFHQKGATYDAETKPEEIIGVYQNSTPPVSEQHSPLYQNSTPPVSEQHNNISINNTSNNSIYNLTTSSLTTTTNNNLIGINVSSEQPSNSSSGFDESKYEEFITSCQKVSNPNEMKKLYMKAIKEGTPHERLMEVLPVFVKEYQEQSSDKQYAKKAEKFFTEDHYIRLIAIQDRQKKLKGSSGSSSPVEDRLSGSQEAENLYNTFGKEGMLQCPKCGGTHMMYTEGSVYFTCTACNTGSDYHHWRNIGVEAVR